MCADGGIGVLQAALQRPVHGGRARGGQERGPGLPGGLAGAPGQGLRDALHGQGAGHFARVVAAHAVGEHGHRPVRCGFGTHGVFVVGSDPARVGAQGQGIVPLRSWSKGAAESLEHGADDGGG
ncbi:hypothetical protein D3C78_1527380 [compost metagenome]